MRGQEKGSSQKPRFETLLRSAGKSHVAEKYRHSRFP